MRKKIRKESEKGKNNKPVNKADEDSMQRKPFRDD